jgi:antitoxin CcdA
MGLRRGGTVFAYDSETLANEVKREYWQKWNEENKEAIDHYNARIESEGLPLAQYRTF